MKTTLFNLAANSAKIAFFSLAIASCSSASDTPVPPAPNPAVTPTLPGAPVTPPLPVRGEAATPATESFLPTSQAIAEVAVDAVYVANGGDATISVVDPNAKKLIGTIVLENVKYPHHVNISPDGSKLAVASPGMDMSGGHHGGMAGMRGAVIVLDAKTGKTLVSRRMDAMNHNAIFTKDGSELWTAAMATLGQVLRLDALTLEPKGAIDVGSMPAEITFSNDGKRAFVANGGSDSVSVIDVATAKVEQTIAVDKGPVGAWPGSDGVMYVDCEASKSLVAIDSKTLAVVRKYNLGFTPGMVRAAPNDSLWVTDGDNGKVQFNMLSEDMGMGDVDTGAGAHGLVFSNDGKTAFVTNQKDDSLSILDVESMQVIGKVAVGKKPNGLTFRGK